MGRVSLVIATLLLFAGRAQGTYSVVATDRDTRQVGGAITSCVGTTSVAFVYGPSPGHGGINAQAAANTMGRDRGVALLGMDVAPADIITMITAASFDRNAASRQYGVVDLMGRAAGWTGAGAQTYKEDRQGTVGAYTYSVQGNILTSKAVIDGAEAAFRGNGCDLAERLMLALEGGAQNGEGDSRCTRTKNIPSDSISIEVDPEGMPAGAYLRLAISGTGTRNPIVLMRTMFDTWRRTHPCGGAVPDGGAVMPDGGAAGTMGGGAAGTTGGAAGTMGGGVAGTMGGAAGTMGGAAGTMGAAAGTVGPPGDGGGCGCRAAPGGAEAVGLALVALMVALRRRRVPGRVAFFLAAGVMASMACGPGAVGGAGTGGTAGPDGGTAGTSSTGAGGAAGTSAAMAGRAGSAAGTTGGQGGGGVGAAGATGAAGVAGTGGATGAAGAAGSGAGGAAGAPVVRDETLKMRASMGMVPLQAWYHAATGLWDLNDWWTSGNQLETTIDYTSETGDMTYVADVDNTFVKNQASKFDRYGFYDDDGWWAITWIKAYDLTKQQKYLDMAKTIFQRMAGGWDTKCGGGIYWAAARNTQDGLKNKNAIPNSLFMQVAAKLHLRTPGDGGAGSFLEWAQREWTWFKGTGMLTAKNQVVDGLDGLTTCKAAGPIFTYNNGVLMGALVDLASAAGDATLLDQARAIGQATMTSMATTAAPQGILKEAPCGGDICTQFKGVFMRNLLLLHRARPAPEYAAFARKQSDQLWNGNKNAQNQFGYEWHLAFDKATASRQSSALDALIAAYASSSAP